MTRSGSGAAGAATAIAGSTADTGVALDEAALTGAMSDAASSRDSRPPPKTTAPASTAKATTARVVHSLRRKLCDGQNLLAIDGAARCVVERTGAAATAARRAAAVTSGPKMRTPSSITWARESARYVGAIETISLQSFERALTTVSSSPRL